MSFTIRELESLSGIKAHTIRIWEQRYNFLKPARTQTNIRTYSNDELKTLLTVSLLNRYGYKISRIDQMHPEQRVLAILELPHHDAQIENLVNEMIGCMIDLKSMEFEILLDRHIQQHGIEKTVKELIFFFLDKVGILWQTNRILPAQEHIVSNIIRQKIVRAIDLLPFVQKQQPLFLLFLPEDEHHEMGLLFVYYLLRKNNLPVIYLGANVPLKDIGYLFQMKQPDFLYLHLTSFPRQHNFQKYLTNLSSKVNNTTIFISGSATQSYKKALPSNVRFFTSFSEVITYVSSLA
jgi:MerR family transcriptional regulator, light-induced transcriptional regulator